MLSLVFAYWDLLWLVQQDIGRLENWVSKQSHRSGVSTGFLRLVFELSHARGFTKTCDAVQNPSKLCVSWNLGLHKQCRFFWIDAGS
jgi:hypothetical protein